MKVTGMSFHMGNERGRHALSRIASVALELAIVFVGVYAAFGLSQYETRRRTAERRHELQDALVQEIGDLTSNTRRVAKQLPLQLQRFDSARRAGSRPALHPWLEPVRRRPYMWQLTVQSGALETFDVPTVYRLSRFYNELEAGFDQIAQLRSLSQSVLIPNLGRGSGEFYEPDGRTLRPKYRWYRVGLARLADLAASITAQGDSLVARLAPSDTAAGSPK